MGRGPKPAKSKEAKPPVARQSPKRDGVRVLDLEKRLAEALKLQAETQDQQRATSEILRTIAHTQRDMQPVLDALTASATRLCDAVDAYIFRVDGQELRLVAHHGPIAALPIGACMPLVRETAVGRTILDARTVHVADLQSEAAEFPVSQKVAERLDYRSVLNVPLMHEGVAIGLIGIRRAEAQLFTERQVALLETFADQAVIAVENVRLFKELESRNRDLTEALGQQTATAEILRVISTSPTDLQPVLDTVVTSAARFCGAYDATLFQLDGDVLKIAAHHGPIPNPAGLVLRKVGGVLGRAVLDRGPIHVTDIQAQAEDFPEGSALAREMGYRTVLGVPLLREGTAIGAIGLRRIEADPFTHKQIDLLQTFADQAVIAIENVRLFTELQEKNKALTQAHAQVTETLDQQTATSEVLKVISRSAFDLQPVLDSLIENAVRLCGADRGFIHRQDGEFYPVAANYGHTPEWVDVVKRNPIRGDRTSATGRAALERRVIHIPDVLADPEYRWAENQTGQEQMHRTVLSVPMLREGAVVGVITIRRTHVEPFTDKQVELVTTFADQAVIAIENVRLFTETKEALEQQTATSEILRVISGSPTDIQPVLDAVAERAARLCNAFDALIYRLDSDRLRLVAHHGPIPAPGPIGEYTRPLGRGMVSGRVVLDGRTVHVADMRAEADEFPETAAQRIGSRTVLGVPLIREGVAIGAIILRRMEVQPFTDKQIHLVTIFADQAVIAIENVRLFTETKEALERQTATAEILRVISSSPTDLQPVFDTIVRNAVSLCGAAFGGLHQIKEGGITLDAQWGMAADDLVMLQRHVFPLPLSRGAVTGRAILDRTVIHIPDIREDPGYHAPLMKTMQGYRTVLGVPMIREDISIGALALWRPEVRPFSETEIGLVRSFADQAVIAIENVRLFTELQEKNKALTTAHAQVSEALEQQTATAEVLKVISRSTFDLTPVFETLAENAVRLCEARRAFIFRFDGEFLRMEAAYNASPEVREYMVRNPTPVGRRTASGRAALERRTIHIPDVQGDPEYMAPVTQVEPIRTILGVPMLKGDELLGVIVAWKREVKPFTEKQIALVETFADQAVIAIENARLFAELQARTGELTRSVDELTALGEVGRAVSSTLDLETVLTTIVSRAVQLADLEAGAIYEYDEVAEVFHLRATQNLPEEFLEIARPLALPKGEGATGRLAVTREPVQIPDITAPDAYHGRMRDVLLRMGHRALLAVPLISEDHIVGGLVVNRRQPGEFAPEVIELLRTFATQSALAIQNARLFREIEDKSRQLEVASQHKSEFLANMSHELRTPLNAIIGFSEVLAEKMFGELNEKQEEYSKDIHASGQHLLSLINDILDLSKIEAGRMELELSDFHLPTALDSALTLVRERAGRRGIALHMDVDSRLGEIQADERKVRQVVLNLLSNAIKFTPEGGRIEVGAAPKDGLVEVSVSDTGVGIAPEDQEAVFEEFRQVGTADKKVEGTGLGLTLCRKFVELHGGQIWVKSELGVGSTFTFTIPVRRDE